MNIADEMDKRIDQFIADNNLPKSLMVQFRAAAWIGASIANEVRMEEERNGIQIVNLSKSTIFTSKK